MEPKLTVSPVDKSLFESAAHLLMPDAPAGMAFTGTSPSGHIVMLDTGVEHGGASLGPDPQSLLLLALGSCSGMDVISILRKKRQKISAYGISVYADRAADHPRVYTRILVEHVVTGTNIDGRAVARSIELSTTKYCPVHALLSKVTQVEHVYRIVDVPEENKTRELSQA